ncbi:MAG TPA: exodeoxyribonuclease VII large subunit [Devosiaceae bacterium]
MSDAPTNTPEYSVSEISQAVKRTLEDSFGNVRVRGEVSKVARPGSGHIYFDLKDEGAVIAAVVWRGVAGRLRFLPEQGLEVVVTGRLTTFPGQSKYQLVVDDVVPAGAGALMALLEERRKKLLAEGLFDPARKKPLPYLPRVIGVVTSPTGAVIRDILHRLDDRFPTRVIVWPVRVQGETCAPEVSAAIAGFNALPKDGLIPRPDLLIVARGGGSIEDLWGFNEESVVRAVAASTIPVISAVGHETDTTLCDFAADKRAPTPTGAAEIAVPVRSELIGYVDDLGSRQRSATRRLQQARRDQLRAAASGLPRPADLLNSARQRLDIATTRLAAALAAARQAKALRLATVAPRLTPGLLRQRVRDLAQRGSDLQRRGGIALEQIARRSALRLAPAGRQLQPAFARTTLEKARRLESLGKLLTSLSYVGILQRGFALVTTGDEQLVRSASALQPGEAITIAFHDGKVAASVDGGSAAARPAGRPRPPDKDSQTELF